MQIIRFHATDDGGSCFQDIDIPLSHRRSDAQGHTLALSTPYNSVGVQVAELPEGLDQTWHPAPRRQLVTVLRGRVEVTTTDGETRAFTAGQSFLADDVGSRGHKTRTVGGPAHVLFAPLPEGFSVEQWAAPR